MGSSRPYMRVRAATESPMQRAEELRRSAPSNQLERFESILSGSLEVQKSCMESQKAMQTKIDSLQAKVDTMQAKLDAAANEARQANMKAEKDAMQAKLDASALTMKAEVEAERAKLQEEALLQSLKLASDHCEFGQFLHAVGYSTQSNSGPVVKEVMAAFMKHEGFWISDDYRVNENAEAGRAVFRTELSRQIVKLTGVFPKVEEKLNDEGEMQWIMYRT